MSLEELNFRKLKPNEAYDSNGNVVNLLEKKKEGKKIFADIGGGVDSDILELASEDAYIVLVNVERSAPMLKYSLKEAAERGLPNICAQTTRDTIQPFGKKLFDRVEAHYLLTSKEVDVDTMIFELLRILDEHGLLIISGEFGAKWKQKAQEALLAILDAVGDYNIISVSTPLSNHGRIFEILNTTYLISEDFGVIDEEIHRLRRVKGLGREAPKTLSDIFRVEWNEKREIPVQLKNAIAKLLNASLQMILINTQIVLGKEEGDRIIMDFEKLAIVVRHENEKKVGIYVVVGNKFDESKILCTLKKK